MSKKEAVSKIKSLTARNHYLFKSLGYITQEAVDNANVT